MATIPFDRYEIRRELGRGAMGVVYEAHDPGRGVDLALKVLATASGLSPDSRKRRVERFYREARALQEISHPNVVRVFDQGEVSGRCFFTMELVRGTTLRDRIQFQGALSVPELVRLVTEIGDALDHIHGRGVVHRDIKPENIMLMPDGSAKLMDFGVAQLMFEEGAVPSGGFHGSPAYMSPEQVAGRVVDGRSDIYSLAVTLYEAASGRRAVEGDSVPEVTHRVANEYPPPPPGLPPHIQAALMRALAKSPDHRYARAGELAEDIRTGRITPAPNPEVGTAYAMPAYTQPAPVYLGAVAGSASGDLASSYPSDLNAQQAPAPAAPAPIWPALPSASDGMSAPDSGPQAVAAAAPVAAPAGPVSRAACRTHPSLAGIAACAACGQPMCYTCYVELPGRGAICRSCAFGRRA